MHLHHSLSLSLSLGYRRTGSMFRKPNTLALFVLLLLIIHNATSIDTEAPSPQPQQPNTNTKLPSYGTTQGSLHPQECGERCRERCSKTAFKKPCLFFCQKCCAKCLCVPAGTYGNKQSCPCYNNWKTKRGGPKCP